MADQSASAGRMPGAWLEPHQSKNHRVMVGAVATFAITVVLVLFVDYSAFMSTRDSLAAEFADEHQLISLYAATHLRDLYQMGVYGLMDLARDAGQHPDLAGQAAKLAEIQASFGNAHPPLFRFGAGGELREAFPAGSAPPAAGPLGEALAGVRAANGPPPVFYVGADQVSRLLLARGLPRQRGALLLDIPLPSILEPFEMAEGTQTDILVIDPPSLRVIASTNRRIPADLPLDQLFTTPTGKLFDAVRRSEAGSEINARSTLIGGEREEGYILGVVALELGHRQLVLASLSPRGSTVDRWLRQVLTWLLGVGAVLLLGLVSFVTLAVQSANVARQEKRRREERNWLYQISLGLLSVSKLDDILGRIADQSRGLFRAQGASIVLVDHDSGDLHFRCVSDDDESVRAQLQGLRQPSGTGVVGWVVDHGEGVIVRDTSHDQRFSGATDTRTGFHTASILCAPLFDEGGQRLGAIELVTSHEAPFSDSDLLLLQSLAIMASAAIGRAMMQEVEERQARLRREMEIARTVQQGLLPRSFPALPGFDVHGASQPAREVGGDFYDFIQISDRHLGVVIADVADKGLGAAMFMVMCRSLLYSCAARELSPAKVLSDLNARILEFSAADLFVTCFYGVLDVAAQTFTYTNAGHNPPVFYRRGEGPLRVTLPGMALGVIEDVDLQEARLSFAPGDRLVLYTDGITESNNPAAKQFGMLGLEQVLTAVDGVNAPDTVAAVLSAVEQWADEAPQFDDIAIAVVHASDTMESSPELLRETLSRR